MGTERQMFLLLNGRARVTMEKVQEIKHGRYVWYSPCAKALDVNPCAGWVNCAVWQIEEGKAGWHEKCTEFGGSLSPHGHIN